MTNADAPRTEAPDPLRAAAKAVVEKAEPDEGFEGEYIEYLVPAEAVEALRAAVGVTPDCLHPRVRDAAGDVMPCAMCATPAPERLDVERLAEAIKAEVQSGRWGALLVPDLRWQSETFAALVADEYAKVK